MIIATWNVNGLRARIDFFLRWLEERRPDVVGLQELKLTEDKFPAEAIESAGYKAAVYGQKAWNGVAVLSREEPELVQTGLPGEDGFGSRLITVNVCGIDFTSVYVPNGKSVDHDDYPKKLAWLDTLAAHFRENHDPTGSVVLCGDFNVVPAPMDSWNEEKLARTIFHTDEERQRYRNLLEWGFVDGFRAKFPEEQQFSWWDYRAGGFPRNMGLRIDFLLATAPVANRIVTVGTDREWRKKVDGMTPSDHAPVIAELADE